VAEEPMFGFYARLAEDPSTEINWAGESAGLVDRVQPAAEIVRELVAAAGRHLQTAARLVE
jgi:hypothetical protein